nr:reverse transcriptase domain-containing protein [Tanacetum cinerariifolium]
MLTARKSVRSLLTHRLALRYPSDSSSSDQFTSEDSSRDSSSETSSDSHSDTSSNSSSRHYSSGYAISETPCDSSIATSKRPSRKRCRSPILSVPVSSPVRRALSLDGYELYVPREVGLRVDVEDSYEPYTEPNIDSDVQTDIDKCIAYADAIRARGIDDRDVVETAATKEVEPSARGTIEVEVDLRVRPVVDYDVRASVREDVPDHITADEAVKVTYEKLGDLGHRIARVDLEVTTVIERINALEQDNTRLRGMLDVESQRVDRLQHGTPKPTHNLRTSNKTIMSKEMLIMGMVKHATCTLLDGVLTWWNSHKRTVGVDDSYAMMWKALIKIMTEVYCPRNEIQKMET